jgi:uncharacterized protein DUF5335
MPTREIPERQWRAFFDSFSLQHKGWLVSIEVLSPDIGAQVEARDIPLAGITASEDSQSGETIEIIVGQTADKHLSHTITRPDYVAIKQTDEGADEALEVRSEDGTITLVRFRSAMPVVMVDGL